MKQCSTCRHWLKKRRSDWDGFCAVFGRHYGPQDTSSFWARDPHRVDMLTTEGPTDANQPGD